MCAAQTSHVLDPSHAARNGRSMVSKAGQIRAKRVRMRLLEFEMIQGALRQMSRPDAVPRARECEDCFEGRSAPP
jgi:hypothetical protein